MAITTAMRTQVAELYVALFGRAPESDGLSYWVTRLDAGASFAQVGQEMFDVAPSRAYYPSYMTNSEVVASFYQHVLGRTGDTAGLAYWTARLNASNEGTVITEMITATVNYHGTDAAALSSQALFNNKVETGLYYGVTLNGNNVNDATNILSTITADHQSVIDAEATQTAHATTTSFTTAVDNLVGTSGNDQFLGYFDGSASSTLQSFDTVDGGAGLDTLKASYTGGSNNVSLAATNVETLSLRPLANNSSVTLDLGLSTGVTNLTIADAALFATNVTLNNVSSNMFNITARDVAQANNNNVNVSVGFTANVGTGTNDTLTLNLENAGHVQDGTTNATFNINSFASAGTTSNFIENLAITAGGTGNHVTVGTGMSNVAKVTITGAGDLQLSDSGNFSKVTTLTASAATGDLFINDLDTAVTTGTITATLGSGNDYIHLQNAAAGASMVVDTGAGNDYINQGSATNVTLTTGAGNDFVVNSAANATVTHAYNLGAGNDTFLDLGNMHYNVADTVDGGAGIDTVFMSSTIFAGNTGMTTGLTGFEQLGINGGGTYNLANFAGITKLVTWADEFASGPDFADHAASTQLNGWNSANVVITNAESGLTSADIGGTGSAFGFSVDLATDTTADVFTVNLAGTGNVQIGSTNINTPSSLSLDDYETININSSTADTDATTGPMHINTIASISSGDLTTLNITGANDLTISGLTTAALTKIDASAATGDVKVMTASTAASSVAFLGGSGNDTYVGTSHGDAIRAGAGGDAITLTGTAASDTLVYGASDSMMTAAADGFDKVTNFTATGATHDVIDLGGLTLTTSTSAIKTGTVTTDFTNGTTLTGASFFNDGTTNRAVAAMTNGSDTYVFVDADGDGNYSATHDLVIELVGASGVTVSDFGFSH